MFGSAVSNSHFVNRTTIDDKDVYERERLFGNTISTSTKFSERKGKDGNIVGSADGHLNIDIVGDDEEDVLISDEK